jgi:hypothetical protein
VSDENLARLKATKRNDVCPCGSGRKYKKCHLEEDEAAVLATSKAATAAAEKARAAEAEAEADGEGDGAPTKESTSGAKAERVAGKQTKPAKRQGQNPRPKNLPRRKAV